jgi:hypothetical protein
MLSYGKAVGTYLETFSMAKPWVGSTHGIAMGNYSRQSFG